MDLKDTIQFILAIWGAALSTDLGIIKLSENKRQIRVFLDFIPLESKYKLVVVNIGHRPITIIDAGVRILPKDIREYGGKTPILREDLEGKISQSFPTVLNDGQSFTMVIFDSQEFIYSGNYRCIPYAFDVERKEYIAKNIRDYDVRAQKYGRTRNL
jgi:hypothetical protein